MKKPGLIMSLLALLASGVAQAASWSGDTKLTELSIEQIPVPNAPDAPGVYAKFDPEPFPDHTCANHAGWYQLSAEDADVRRQMYSAAVELMHTGQRIKVFWVGCNARSYPVLKGIDLLPPGATGGSGGGSQCRADQKSCCNPETDQCSCIPKDEACFP